MGKVEIPYYVVKRNGRGFWQPTKRMKALGFASIPCGPDGPEAWSRAQMAYERWLRFRRGDDVQPEDAAEAAERFPGGSVGEAWQRYIRTKEWASKAASTRNKVWWPAWRKRIKPMFGDMTPDSISFELVSEWRAAVVESDGLDPAHKAMKVWRAFWNVMVAMGSATKADPSLAVRNVAPEPRQARWTEGEVVRLVKAAIRRDWLSLAAIVAAIWDSSFQPGDVRLLRAKHLIAEDGERIWFDRTGDGREKTGVAAIGTVSARTDRLVRAYLARQGVEMVPEALIFRNRFGRPYRDDGLADDFAEVREAVFPGDRRQMRDMRRSGAVEVIAGGGRAESLSRKLANSVHQSDRLWKTYVPVDEASVREADRARLRGRALMRGNESVMKVGTPKK